MFAATANHLRVRHGHEHHRVTYVELFFDLVFVFAITQLSHGLLKHLTPLGAVQTALLMLARLVGVDLHHLVDQLVRPATGLRCG